MPPCVHHRFSRLPIARIHLSHRSPELISAFASVRPSARSTTIHAPSRSFLLPSYPPPVCSLSLFLPSLSTYRRYPSRITLSPRRGDPRRRCHRRCRSGCTFDRRYNLTLREKEKETQKESYRGSHAERG